MEIEVKQKLIRNQKKYDIPDTENAVTVNQLRELFNMKEDD